MVGVVTGARGFLGSAISDRLEGAGWQVARAGRPDVEIPSAGFSELLADASPDLIVHCAGPASVADSISRPAADFAGSAGVLAAVLDQARMLEPQPRFLLLSSAAVYGDPQSLPVDERQPLVPVSPYGHHRVTCESLITEFNRFYGLPASVMRIFSAYGEGLSRQILWDACRKGLEHGRIELHGTGSESRDFIHADDVAGAAMRIIDRGGFEGEPYNVASGRETTIAELAELLRAGLGLPEGTVSFGGDTRSGDPLNWRADISKLRELGFEPQIPIDVGARAYARWARELPHASTTSPADGSSHG